MDARLWQQAPRLRHHLDRLKDSVDLLKALALELEVIGARRCEEERVPGQAQGNAGDRDSDGDWRKLYLDGLVGREIRENGGSGGGIDVLEEAAMAAAGHLRREVEAMMLPLEGVVEGTAPWEELTAVAKFRDRRTKLKSNRKRRKVKRQQDAIKRRMADKAFEEADRQAEEWRTREIAKDISKRKMEKMNELARKKAKEERLRLEKEMESVLLGQKLEELRSLRMQKLKKQGHLFPEDDDKFMESVRAAVEAEEQQAAAAAAAAASSPRDAGNIPENSEELSKKNPSEEDNANQQALPQPESKPRATEASTQRLPPDMHRYYCGSNIDMGTLIEVRRGWDTYIMPGGSRIPGHWVQPAPPTSDAWASCLKE